MGLIIWNESKFEKYQIDFLRVIYADQGNFQWAIRSIRVVLGLPPEGMLMEINNGKLRFLEKAHQELMNKIDFNKLTVPAGIVLGMYNLPRTWLPTIETIIIMNVAFPLSELEQVEVLSELKIVKLSQLTNVFRKSPIYTSQDQFVIVVRDGFQSDFDSFINYLTKKKKSEIVEAMGNLPSNPKKIKSHILPIQLRVSELKSTGISWENIANTIESEFGDSSDTTFSVDKLRTYHKRLKKQIISRIAIDKGYARIVKGTL